MIRKLLLVTVLGVSLSGCFMAPLALIGPASSGFTTASIVQSGISTGASYIIKKSTGKTISEHIIQSLEGDVFKQAFLPKRKIEKKYKTVPSIDLETKVNTGCKKYDLYSKE